MQFQSVLFKWAGLAAVAVWIAACSSDTKPGLSGYAEGDYLYIASPIAGKVEKIYVDAGQKVQSGAPLFLLDTDNEKAAQEEATARLESARAQSADLQSGKRKEEIAVIQAQIEEARAAVQLAESDLERQQQLLTQAFVAKARVDDAKTVLQQAKARVEELQSSLAVAKLPARSDARNASSANAVAAQNVLRQSVWRTTQKSQTAPAAAEVAEVYFRPGEFVSAGQPVVSLLPPENIKARFFVSESVLGGLKTGQEVSINCDGCGKPIVAHISRISTQAEFTPPVIYSNSERSKLVFMVEAKPDAQDAARLKPGQPLDVQLKQ